MFVGRAVRRIPSAHSSASFKNAPKPFICHRSVKFARNPFTCHTSKIAVYKSFVCHTCDTPGLPFVSCLFPTFLRAAASLRYHILSFPLLATRRSPLPPSLSYTRRIKFTQGFAHDHSGSICSGFATGPQRAQRRCRRQAQEIPLAFGD